MAVVKPSPNRELIRVTVIGALSVFELGSDIELDIVKRYRYAGEDREKLKTVKHPYNLNMSRSSSGVPHVTLRSYSGGYEPVKADTEVAVFRVIK